MCAGCQPTYARTEANSQYSMIHNYTPHISRSKTSGLEREAYSQAA